MLMDWIIGKKPDVVCCMAFIVSCNCLDWYLTFCKVRVRFLFGTEVSN